VDRSGLERVVAPAKAGRDPYPQLTEIYHRLLSEESLDALLESIAVVVRELIPYDTLTIYKADESQRILIPLVARDRWAEEIMQTRPAYGMGITGWAVEHGEAVLANEAHLDDRVTFIPGTPLEPEALICVPLVARGLTKGALNIYRQGGAIFTQTDFEMAKSFADAIALALDNAEVRDALRLQAQTDPLTGLYNHRFFHERLKAELARAGRVRDVIALMMFDIDDFKRLNDVHGHATGDQVLVGLADAVRATCRTSDVPCRIGGEEFAVILPSCDTADAVGLARRLRDRLAVTDFDPAGHITVSIGIAQGPDDAVNARDLAACAETAMMTAKARGKDRSALYSEDDKERPEGGEAGPRDGRSLAHLKMLQSLAGKLNRLNDVKQIGNMIATELRTLVDYHNCRVYLADETDLYPIAQRGESEAYEDEAEETLVVKIGEGITGRAALTGRSLLISNALECEFAVQVPGTDDIVESIVAVPMLYGTRVNGVVVISKLGMGQFDEGDVRLLEVLAGQAAVALQNARLYEAQRREAENAQSLLAFTDQLAQASTVHDIGNLAVRETARLAEVEQVALWMLNPRTLRYECAAHHGYAEDPEARPLIKRWFTEEEAATVLQGHKQPFTVTPARLYQIVPRFSNVSLRTLAIVPLQDDHETKGWMSVRQPRQDVLHFTKERLRFLTNISTQVSTAMQKARLYREQKESADIASALLDFSRQLATADGLEAILDRTVELAARLVGSPKTTLWLQEPETGDMVVEALWGFEGEARRKIMLARLPLASLKEVFLADDPFVLRPEDYGTIAGNPAFGVGFTYAIAPLRLDNGRLGGIVAVAPALGDYEISERKMRLLAGIADQAKIAINNASGYETLESTFLSTVEALANALEVKDEYTSSHARSIVDMSLEVGAEMGRDQKCLKRLELGALFHDIGKIGIPSEILLKPGPLTDEEFEIIKTHPEQGERILEPIERLADVRPIVRHCHEHFDGSGYPDAISGDDIPLESRIILICDAFHAMTTDRPYRERLPVEEARRRLQKAAGGQFDPRVVACFLKLLDERPEFAIASHPEGS
jgi:diguanylate cyclase (GGDEF)-like protein